MPIIRIGSRKCCRGVAVGKTEKEPRSGRVAVGAKALVAGFFLAITLFTGLFASNAAADETCLSDFNHLEVPQHSSFSNYRAQPVTSTKLKVLRMIVIASGDFTGGRSDAEVFEQIFNALNLTNEYLRPLRVKVELAGVQAFQPGAGDPYAAPAAKRDASEMLKLARAEWVGRNYPAHDLVAVFGRSAFGSTYGLAYPDTVCLQPNYAFLFASQGGAGQAAELSFGATLAHEIGHTLGLSHDSKFYAEGPSLMWPYFSPNVNGISDFSLTEFDAYKMAGGTACLPEVDDENLSSGTTPTLVFAGAPTQSFQVREGERLRTTFPVVGSHPGVTYTAENLPPGAQFDALTGELDFTADYWLLTGKKMRVSFDSTIIARTYNDESRLALRITVTRTNRAPMFSATEFEAVEGAPFQAVVTASDSDAGDKVSLKLENARSLKGYPGAPRAKTSGSTFQLSWLPPVGAAADYLFSLRAKDKFGGETRTNVVVRVRAAQPQPVIDAPVQVSGAGGNPIAFQVTSSGAAEQMKLTGLEPGMLIRESASGIEIQYAPTESTGEVIGLTVEARAGSAVVQRVIPIALPKNEDAAAVQWPGSAKSAEKFGDVDGDGVDEAHFYDPRNGGWRHLSCSGAESAAVFGGRTGDLPLVLKRGGRTLRAVYRVVNGQGWWVLDDGSSSEEPYGLSGDIPVPADIDGDGNDEFIVYRPRSAEYFIAGTGAVKPFVLESSDRVVPFAGDIDGDGKAELARFRRTAAGELLFEARMSDEALLTAVVSKVPLAESALPLVADVDGDGRLDFGAQIASGLTNWFVSSMGKIVSQETAAIPSRSLFAFRRCGSGSSLLVSDTLLASAHEMTWTGQAFSQGASLPTAAREGEATVDSLRLRNAVAKSAAAFGDSSGASATEFSVWRENSRAGVGQWIRRMRDNGAAFYSELPNIFSYRGHAHRERVFTGGLFNYSDGLWTSQNSDGSVSLEYWGAFGDVPVAGDYNGDGRTDVAVFRPNTGTWWILYTDAETGGKAADVRSWGEKGDVPVPADYDGDGSTDVAIWRPKNGAWFIRYGDGRTETISLGSSTDVPLPDAYLGLGLAQPAVWRPSSGEWIIQAGRSKDTLKIEQWGLSSDVPVHGDFDGDGRSDLAVFRSSEGSWYLRNAGDADGRVVQFGLPGDRPLGAANTLRIF